MKSDLPKRLGWLLALILCLGASLINLNAAALTTPQGQLGGPQIATLSAISGDVRVSRAAAPTNLVPISDRGVGLALANGDAVQTLRGRAEIRFNDASIVRLFEGTVVVVQERPVTGGIQRTISQIIGSLWFNIQKITGPSTTTLETPTAIAAIRGTQGQQDVPGPDQSTHSLNEGVQLVTERITRQSITIRAGQRVTAIRGIGFAPVVALAGLLAEPAIGGGGGAAGGGGATGGGGAGAGAASATATGATAATTSVATTTISSLTASVLSVAVPAGTIAATTSIPLAVQSNETKSTPSDPLVRPGGALTALDGASAGVSLSAPAGSSFVSGLGGSIPMTAASGSIWALGAITHNTRVTGTGQKATQAVLTADALAGLIRATRRNQTLASGNALRTFAFASVIGRQYRDKPLVVIGAYGFAAAASYSHRPDQKRFPTDVLVSAAIGELLGRIVTQPRAEK